MIGILFFLFEFYDDQLLAFMVLILVWLCELFTLIRYLSQSLNIIILSVVLGLKSLLRDCMSGGFVAQKSIYFGF